MAQRNNFESRPENIERINKMIDFCRAQKEGEMVTWLDVEKSTGISCRSPVVGGVDGRGLMRRAWRKMHIHPEVIYATGFRMPSAENAVIVTNERVGKVLRTAKRARDCANDSLSQFGERMTAGARDRLTRASAFMATLSMQAQDARKALK